MMKLLIFTLMLVFSVSVLDVGMPTLEISRQEARFAQAYCHAKQIKLRVLPEDTLDPWGSPFTIIQDDRNQIVSVVSPGPNRSTEASGTDVDDIASEMLSPPHHTMIVNKQLQLVIVLGLSVSPWFVAAAVLIRSLFPVLPTNFSLDRRASSDCS